MNYRCLFRGFIIVAILGLAGCALSPQKADLNPEIPLPQSVPIINTTASVKVQDARTTTVVGSRGGVYSDSSQITTGVDLAEKIRQASERALRIMGVTITDQDPAYHINIYLDQLDYKVPAEKDYVTKVDVSAIVRIEAEHDGQRFSGRYNAQAEHRVIKAPSEEQNNTLLNDVLNDALTRGFQDSKLINFLKGNG